jgi:hypothetical protein
VDDITDVLDKIKAMLVRLDFKTVEINGRESYENRGLYCRPFYLRQLGFIIEYADSFEFAKREVYEDGDAYPMNLGETEILAGLMLEVKRELEREDSK